MLFQFQMKLNQLSLTTLNKALSTSFLISLRESLSSLISFVGLGNLPDLSRVHQNGGLLLVQEFQFTGRIVYLCFSPV